MKKFIKILCSGVITTSILLNSINVFANVNERVVKISVNNKLANVNGENVTLNIAPYIQQPSESMMIPLRFVSTALGIEDSNIKFNPTTKEITINYKGKEIKFISGTSKMYINGEEFDMTMKDIDTNERFPIYTEIKNGSTFIPLRALDVGVGVKIEWEGSTKTAIMKNEVEESNTIINTESTTNEIESNSNVSNNNQPKELTEEEIRAMEEEVVRLVNEERAKHNLHPLEISEKLMKTAREKSNDMLENDYFGHEDPNGYNMARDLNVAENLTGYSSTPFSAVDDWMRSKKGHRENILDPRSKYIGVGLASNIYSEYQYYWTQQFSMDDKWANEN